MKKLAVFLTLGVTLLASVGTAEAGRYYRGGGNFWGGFAAGAVTGALTSALLRPPAVVAAPPPVVAPRVYAPRRMWVPGAYVVRYKPCGTPYRAWRRGYYRGGH